MTQAGAWLVGSSFAARDMAPWQAQVGQEPALCPDFRDSQLHPGLCQQGHSQDSRGMICLWLILVESHISYCAQSPQPDTGEMSTNQSSSCEGNPEDEHGARFKSYEESLREWSLWRLG